QMHRIDIWALCSGYDAIGMLLVFLAAYLWWYRRRLRFPHAFLLIPLTSLALWCAIVLRLFVLVLMVPMSGEAAVSAAHSQIGWVLFTVGALGILLIAGRLFRTDKSDVLLKAISSSSPESP